MTVSFLTMKNWNSRYLSIHIKDWLAALKHSCCLLAYVGCAAACAQPTLINAKPSSSETATEQTLSNSKIAANSSSNGLVEVLPKNNQRNLSQDLDIPDTQEQINPHELNRVHTELKQNPWLFLHAYEATYEVSSEGDKLGTAVRKLNRNGDSWRLQITSKLKKWLLSLKSNEHSDFLIEQNQLFTKEFYTHTKVSFKKKKVIQQNFDWQNKLETGRKDKKTWSLPIEHHLFDRSTHMLKLRSDLLLNKQAFDYPISYKGKRKTYSYSKQEVETIATKFGEFETIKMVRTSGDDSAFSIWLSPELNYFPVKIAQFEQDKPDVVMTLTKLQFLTPE